MFQLNKIIYKFMPCILILVMTFASIVGTYLYINETLPIVYYISIVFGLIVTILFYFREKYIEKHIDNLRLPIIIPTVSNRWQRILDIIFFLIIIIIVIILQTFPTRPICYYILIGILSGVTAASIILTPEGKNTMKHIIKILIISFLAVFSFFKDYYWTDVDLWYHAGINEVLANVGFLYPGMGKEMYTPIQHIAVATAEILGNIDVRTATFISITFALIIMGIAVFIIGKKLCNITCALLAMLIYVTMTRLIYWELISVTTSYAFLVFIVIILTYFGWKTSNGYISNVYFILHIGLVLFMMITHLFSSAILLCVLILLYVGSVIAKNKLFTRELLTVTIYCLGIFIFFLSTSLIDIILNAFNYSISAMWGIINGITGPTIVNPALALNAGQSTTSTAIQSLAMNVDKSIVDFSTSIIDVTNSGLEIGYFFNEFAEFLLLLIPLILLLILTRKVTAKKISNIWEISIACTGLLVMYILFYFILSVMACRFVPFCIFFGGISVAVILYYFLKIVPLKINRKILIGLIIVVIAIIAVFNLSSGVIAPDTPLWNSDAIRPGGGTVSIGEVVSTTTIVGYLPTTTGNAYDDEYSSHYGRYSVYVNRQISNIDNIQEIYGPGSFHTFLDWANPYNWKNHMFIFRDSVLDYPTIEWDLNNMKYDQYTMSRILQIQPSYKIKLDWMFSHVYSSDYIECYPIN